MLLMGLMCTKLLLVHGNLLLAEVLSPSAFPYYAAALAGMFN